MCRFVYCVCERERGRKVVVCCTDFVKNLNFHHSHGMEFDHGFCSRTSLFIARWLYIIYGYIHTYTRWFYVYGDLMHMGLLSTYMDICMHVSVYKVVLCGCIHIFACTRWGYLYEWFL